MLPAGFTVTEKNGGLLISKHGGSVFTSKFFTSPVHNMLFSLVEALMAQEPAPAGSGGWQSYALALEQERDQYRQRVRTLESHQQGDCWYWQGDGMADETEQSPGHWHEKPGVWDSNGKPCKWCANWRKFKELIKKLEGSAA